MLLVVPFLLLASLVSLPSNVALAKRGSRRAGMEKLDVDMPDSGGVTFNSEDEGNGRSSQRRRGSE